MELNKAILQLYPDTDFVTGVILQDDGDGPYIAQWNRPEPQPIQQELDQAWLDYQAGELDRAKTEALAEVRRQAEKQEGSIDTLISGNFVRAIMLNTEIVHYVDAGRPASPSPTVYIISDAMATRRSVTLHDMLELLFARWRDVQGRIATIITELDRAIDEINAATTVAEVEAVLIGLNWV